MPNFFGMAEVVHGLDIPGTRVTTMYEGFHGTIYGNFVDKNAVDINVVQKWAGDRPARILDLCCGLGRFARNLAAAGHSVTAVDLSEDMIARARELWNGQAERSPGSVEFVTGDVTSLDLAEKFDAVVVGGLSLSTFDDDGRAAALRTSRRHLADGGTLLRDYMPRPGWEGIKENHIPFSFPSDQGKAFTVMSVRQAPAEGRQISNMYSEIIGEDGSTRRILSAETVAYLDPPVVAAETRNAGFRIDEEMEIKLPAGPDDTFLRFVMMRCTAG
ncbi:hypothetical protein GCM10027570_45350 [Streptomonospora sediminis]